MVAELQRVVIGIEAVHRQLQRQLHRILYRLRIGYMRRRRLIRRNRGRRHVGFAPTAFQAPNHFSITGRASSGVMSPMIAMVVMSGRKTFA